MILYTACVHQIGDDLTADPQYCSGRLQRPVERVSRLDNPL